ncbi:MAG TPA: stage II sporulation protein D [Clostridiaceae bacterium]|nr:stage II sporulation protein D [Clostridiaceae bacterium]
MKRLIYYTLVIVTVIIILPGLIVKSCSFVFIHQKNGQVAGKDYKSTNQDERNMSGKKNHDDSDNSIYFEDVSSIYWADNRIKVLFDDKSIRELDLEEYVTSVVAAEMPAEFEAEALKAQAVAARTFAYARQKGLYKGKEDAHPNAHVCTDFTHCQAWISKEEALKKWPSDEAEAMWNKIENAVKDTQGMIIVYNGTIANAVFHSTSGGKTENAEDVWNVGPVDYLKSVVSEGEEASPSFKTVTTLTIKEFCNILKSHYPNIKISESDIFGDIRILEYTEGDRVKTIKIGNMTLKGTDVRNIFSLKSANFKLEKYGTDKIMITTYGYGHGVGMSQWGANNMAQKGANWEDIIKHYYVGVDIDTIDNIEYLLSTNKE